VLDELIDSGDEFFDALERSAPDGLLGDESEPSLDLIEPGRVSGCEVEMEAWSRCEPGAYLGVLVGCVVVDDQVHIQFSRHGFVDASRKLRNS